MKPRIVRFLLLFPFICSLTFAPSRAQQSADRPLLLIRCDDIGMCHDVNMAIERVLASGLLVSTSVMFACPWYQEGVEILKKYPGTSVGIHLMLNAEWKNYRWGPVLGATAVPSLVDSLGYFFPSRASLLANDPTTEDVERELRAQIERAVSSGLKIDYLDHHMGAAVEKEEWRGVVEALAKEYGLGISQYFGEAYSNGTYFAKGEKKTDTLVQTVMGFEPGVLNLQVVHIGLDNPEMAALEDLNPFGPKNMSKERNGELNALLSERFRKAISEKNVRLVTYRDVIRERGLVSMKRPERTR